MKKLALFDIDGVIYEGHAIFDQIQNQEARGIITKGTWNKILFEVQEYKSGKKDYTKAANAMLEAYVSSLKGFGYAFFLDDVTHFFLKNKKNFLAYFQKLIPKINSDHDIYLVTTNFQFTCEATEKVFGLEANHLCSVAEVREGKLTGKVELSLAGNKGRVAELIEKYGRKGSIAVGDSENDADMLDLVELPLVMEPNEKLAEIAKTKGWRVVNRDTIAGIITSHAG